MSIPQSGILPEGDNSAFFATYSVDYDVLSTEEGFKDFINGIKMFPRVLDEATKNNSVTVTGTISFGKRLWSFLIKNNEALKGTGDELFDFPGYGKAPSTQKDLYIHIHSKYNGASFDCGKQFVSYFQPNVLSVSDDQMGFVWRDSRDLTGFIDGTENPSGAEERKEAALTEDGCSYVLVQRFVHNLEKWDKLDKESQETIIGRRKDDSEQLNPLPSVSHVAHSDIEFDGNEIKIVRHSLPYGMPNGAKGLWFTAYCHFLKGIDEIEKSLFGLRGYESDMLMSYVTPVTGGYYFVPSLSMLERL